MCLHSKLHNIIFFNEAMTQHSAIYLSNSHCGKLLAKKKCRQGTVSPASQSQLLLFYNLQIYRFLGSQCYYKLRNNEATIQVSLTNFDWETRRYLELYKIFQFTEVFERGHHLQDVEQSEKNEHL